MEVKAVEYKFLSQKCQKMQDKKVRQFIVKMCSNNADFIPDFLASSQKKRPWTKTKQEDQIKKYEQEEKEKDVK